MERVRWGVLGVSGHFIRRVILPIKKSSIVELYGIASRSPEKAKNTAEKYGITKSYSSYDELLEDEDIEAVYIPLPNHLHAKWIKNTADKGKHILCEKPLALTKDEAQESVDYAKSKGVLIMEAFMYRFHPQWKRVLELTSVGEIGEVQSIYIFFAYNNPDPKNIRNNPDYGGGGLLDIGCYAVSISRYLLGEDPSRVISLIHNDSNFQVDILSSGILDFGKARSLFTVATQTFPCQRVDINGSRGYINILLPFSIYPDISVKVSITTELGTRMLEFFPVDHYGLEFEAFSLSIRNEKPTPIPPEDIVNNHKVLDALFESAKTKSWVIV
jgi:predicted dehydrogenase